MPYVKRRSAIVGLGLKRVGNKRGRVRRDAGVQAVAIIERLRERIDSAELQSTGQTAVYIDLQAVIRADALREPVSRVPYGIVCQRRVGRIVQADSSFARRAWRRRADRRTRQVRVHRKHLVVAVRTNVPNAQRSV